MVLLLFDRRVGIDGKKSAPGRGAVKLSDKAALRQLSE